MKISLKPIFMDIRQHLRQPVTLGITISALLVCGGITMAATGHTSVLKLIPGIGDARNSPDNTKASAAKQTGAVAIPPSSTATPTGSSSPSPVRSSAPATINGNVYGVPGIAGEPGSLVAPSNKPLWLSATSLSLAVGRQSGLIIVKSPDNLSICYVSGGIPDIGLGPVYPGQSAPTCGLGQNVIIGPATKPGTYTTHITASTEGKVSNGKYIRYDGYIKVTVTSSPSFWLTAGSQQLIYGPDGATVQAVKATLTVTRDVGYSGSPQIAHSISSSWCASESLELAGPNIYIWTCQLPNPAGHHLYTLNFYGNDATNQRSVWTSINY